MQQVFRSCKWLLMIVTASLLLSGAVAGEAEWADDEDWLDDDWGYENYEEYLERPNNPFEYQMLSNGTVEIISYDGSSEEKTFVVPSEIDGHTVTSIAKEAFLLCDFEELVLPDTLLRLEGSAIYECEELRQINIPSSVKIIEANPFTYCYALESIALSGESQNFMLRDGVLFSADQKRLLYYPLTRFESRYSIPTGTVEIAECAFAGNKALQTIELTEGLEEISKWAFVDNGKLENIHFPVSLQSIGDKAFSGCNMVKEVDISPNISKIGANPFEDCAGLTAVKVTPENSDFTSLDGVLYSGDRTKLIAYPTGKTGEEYTIPEGVLEIGDDGFGRAAYLKRVTVPQGVTRIGDSAFAYCSNLEAVTIAGSVKEIGDFTFGFCERLRSVDFQEGVLELTPLMFSACKWLETVSIPSSVMTIDANAFDVANRYLTLQVNKGSVAEAFALEKEMAYVIEETLVTE